MFFEPSSFSEKRVSVDTIREWASSAMNAYVSCGTDPNMTITKIARVEELLPHQIEHLAAETNRQIHQEKYASATEKYHAANFPLADAKEIIRNLQTDGGESIKMASELPTPRLKDSGPDAYDLFGVKAPQMDKTASLKQNLTAALQGREVLLEKIKDDITLTKIARDNAQAQFIKEAKSLVMACDTPNERAQTLGTLDYFVKQSEFKEGRKMLAKLAYALGKQGYLTPRVAKGAMDYFLEKTADMKAPEELISENLRARVINGNNPLYITLKTFRDCDRRIAERSNLGKLVADQINVIRQRVRAL